MNFKQFESKEKLRGGYYTPLDLAEFLVKWITEIHPKNILEPSCGDGIFLKALDSIGIDENTNIFGFEIDKIEVAKAKNISYQFKSSIFEEDFLKWGLLHIIHKDIKFDAVIGNPPFIRYQYLPDDFKDNAKSIFDILNIKFTKHTNAWVAFVLASLELLRPGGRLAMVLPSELINVSHAQGLRSFLSQQCKKIVIIDPQYIWFTETLQGTILLLAEKKDKTISSEGISIYSVKNKEFLTEQPSTIFDSACGIIPENSIKWTSLTLGKNFLSKFKEVIARDNIYKFKNIAKVDVGIVTGANNFFLIDDFTVSKYHLENWSYPMFGRSEHCPGIIYDNEQHNLNKTLGLPTNFIWFRDPILSKDAQKYISLGEKENLHLRYKCRIRDPWYLVPSVYATEIGMLKRAHICPRLIYNKIGAFTTDTSYRIQTYGINAKKLVYCFFNTLTMLSTELEGRFYGGGVLELVPSEIERLIIPLPTNIDISLEELNLSIKNEPIESILYQQSEKILSQNGIPHGDRVDIANAWLMLMKRRQRQEY